MDRVEIELFGGFAIYEAGGHELKLGTRKARALLAILAIDPSHWHTRERLAGLLWERHGATQARNSLNQALHEIRKLEKATDTRLVEREADRLRLEADSVECDLHRFDTLLTDRPLQAAELYGGDLLEGFELAEQAFVDWLTPRRSHYRALVVEALLAAAAAAAEARDHETGIPAARRLVALEPLDERARRLLMRALAESGNRAEAHRQYRVCEEMLRNELGVDPEPETRALIEEITRHEAASSVSFPEEPDPRLAMTEAPVDGERPVLAVLPFDNFSDDADSAWLGAGLAEDIIFELSAFRWFRVLARTTTFRVSDAALGHTELHKVLGANYVVSGRVRRAGMRLRVNVELVDCAGGEQLWSARFDRALDDLFDIEIEIARQVVAAIEPTLENHEMRRIIGRPPETLTAYELLQRGYWHLYRGTPEDRIVARRCFEASAESDPNYACALAGLAGVKFRDAAANVVRGFDEGMRDCRATAEQALGLDPRHPFALRFLAGSAGYLGQQERALAAAAYSVELCPSFATGYSALAFVLDFLGNFDDARPAADETVRLRPHDPVLHKCILSKAIADYQTGDYPGAERVILDSLRTNQTWWMSNMMLAATAAQRGSMDTASNALERIRDDQPGITLDILLDRVPFADSAHREHLEDGLKRAGWRDGALSGIS